MKINELYRVLPGDQQLMITDELTGQSMYILAGEIINTRAADQKINEMYAANSIIYVRVS